jgi:hypothetical protein
MFSVKRTQNYHQASFGQMLIAQIDLKRLAGRIPAIAAGVPA